MASSLKSPTHGSVPSPRSNRPVHGVATIHDTVSSSSVSGSSTTVVPTMATAPAPERITSGKLSPLTSATAMREASGTPLSVSSTKVPLVREYSAR